jgi:striatin 1/3/4
MWGLVDFERHPYAAYDFSFFKSTFIGHTDIVWSIKAHASLPIIASSSADGTVKLWNHQKLNDPLLSNLTNEKDGKLITPTSIEFLPTNSNHIVVSYADSSIKLFDIETSKEVLNFESQGTYGKIKFDY